MTVRLFVIPSAFDIRISSFSRHLPVFDEVVWNFLQKARWPLEDVAVAATQAHVRICEIKFIARACNRHIKQAPFFLQRIAGIERAAAWEHAIGQPNEKDGMKLETFRLMHT